jgi:hypothetical protein
MSDAPPPELPSLPPSLVPPTPPPLNEGTPPVMPSAPIYTLSTSPGMTAILLLIIPPFPPIANVPYVVLYESPPLAP